MKKELMWFQQNFGEGDLVRYNIRYTPTGRSAFGNDFTCTNTELSENAVLRGRTTWDERDIIEIHGTKEAEVVTIAEPPAAA